jgi:hypothetical protein
MQAAAVALAIVALLARAATVAAAPVRVFLVAGQSNAVGYGADANLLPPALYAPQNAVNFSGSNRSYAPEGGEELAHPQREPGSEQDFAIEALHDHFRVGRVDALAFDDLGEVFEAQLAEEGETAVGFDAGKQAEIVDLTHGRTAFGDVGREREVTRQPDASRQEEPEPGGVTREPRDRGRCNGGRSDE